MKKQKIFFSVFLLLCMLFAFFSVASAYQNQWVTEGDATYYYGSNGKKYTGGPKTIKKGKKKNLYLFDSSGKLIKNRLTKKGKKLYLSQADGSLVTSLKTVKGQIYLGTSKGVLKTGLQKSGGKYYFFDKSKGAALTNAWKKVGKKTYYFNKKGRAYHGGIYTIGKNKYYFNRSAELVTGLYKIKGYYYGFYSKDGRMLYGWRKMNDGQKYYFDPKTGRAYADGFKKIDGKKYYFNNMGMLQKGWIVIGNKRYYLDPKDDGAQTFGQKTIEGTSYNFGSKGYITFTRTGNMTVRVNRKKCVITIYDGNTPIKAMACSVGRPGNETPTGTFFIQDHLRWHTLDGPSWGQYCSHFLPQYLFHSVPMYGTARDPYNVESSNYNALGQPASSGCIRLCVADAKWIYDNVPIGSRVVISDSEPTPLGKPVPIRMPSNTTGKDPTDIWS